MLDPTQLSRTREGSSSSSEQVERSFIVSHFPVSVPIDHLFLDPTARSDRVEVELKGASACRNVPPQLRPPRVPTSQVILDYFIHVATWQP